MNSCIYAGQVRHRRFTPRYHEFSYTLFMLYIDLDELPGLFSRFWLWSAKGFNFAWFRRADHLGDKKQSLINSVRDQVEMATGNRPRGPVRLLTHLRYLGHGFNPVSFYYCFDENGRELDAIVTEVNNTPWGEQFVYVLPAREAISKGGILRFKKDKQFHVSPYMPMDIEYDWRFFSPGKKLNVHMENLQENKKLFDATLTLKHYPITSFNLARVLISYPLVTSKVVIAIYYEAVRLWLKKIPFHSHPDKKEASEQTNNV